MLDFTVKQLIGPEQQSFSASPGNFLIIKILWNYYQEFIKANGGRPIRLFHILKYERK
jgi:hypothetical protein